MKYYKSKYNQVYAYESDGSQDNWIDPDLIPITVAEAMAIANPPPTLEQLQQNAKYEKRYLLKAATEKIDICQDAVDLGIATNAEKSALTEWRQYRVLLNRVDCTTAPDIQWPEQPK
ncbi:Putaive tail fiber assembly protein [Xenorhabdus bovienii str. oregonense]|uniref:Putaive tail fiber assembly protein n=1 Tax=Xenorhabdus bovienii str. oregonense TaxID=1398202 RepID=A0A077P0Z4_XENBV|nr:tail fiber assembly protein [Xenorhabdus bovienii]CDH04388.1 Putaive tail fiber assembly protein [Xenorhabdus bovienii str. oregonense]